MIKDMFKPRNVTWWCLGVSSSFMFLWIQNRFALQSEKHWTIIFWVAIIFLIIGFIAYQRSDNVEDKDFNL